MISAMTPADGFPSRPPTGALRPPVAVGAADTDDGDVGFGAGPNFMSGGRSFAMSTSSGGGATGWSFPAAQSHHSAGVNAEPIYGVPYTGSREQRIAPERDSSGGGNVGWGTADFGGYGGGRGGDIVTARDVDGGFPSLGPLPHPGGASGGGWGIHSDDHGFASIPGTGAARQPRVVIDEAPPEVEQLSGHFGEPNGSMPLHYGYSDYEVEDDPTFLAGYSSAPSKPMQVPAAVPRALSGGGMSVRSSNATTPAAPPTVPVTPQYNLRSVQPLMLAEQWVTSYPALPARTPAITYPGGASVNFHEVAPMLGHVAAANAPHRARMIPAIESGDAVRRTLATYTACDRDLNGILSWANGEIPDFITAVFQQQGLSPPNESQMYALFRKFDIDRNSVLNARECLCLVDAMLRALFFAESPMPYGQPPTPIVLPPARPSSSFVLPPAPVVVQQPGAVAYPFAPGSAVAPLALMPPPPSAASIAPSTRPASQHVLPGGVLKAEVLSGGIAGAHQHGDMQLLHRYPADGIAPVGQYDIAPGGQLKGDIFPVGHYTGESFRLHRGAENPQGQAVAATHTTTACQMGSNKLVVASIAGFKIGDVVIIGGQEEKTIVGFSSILIDSPLEFDYPAGTDVVKAGEGSLPALPSRPSLPAFPVHGEQYNAQAPRHHEEDHELLQAVQGQSTMRPPAAGNDAPLPPKPPPAKPDIEQRRHLIEVELDELELHPDAPDLAPRWYETLRFFVSFHPHSEQPDHIPLPRDAPQRTQEGKHLVSQSVAARMPTISSGPRLSLFGGGDEDEGSKRSGNNPVAEYKETLQMEVPQLDMHLVAYVWARKSSMGSAEDHLIGRSLAPLREFKLQRRQTTWGVFDYMEGHRVAELRVKYAVCTTPGAIQKPALKDVKRTEVAVKWDPPRSDHGAPTLAYRVSILIAQKGSETPQWYTLCPRTKTTDRIYVVTNLDGNSSYMMNIQAINKVGVGDPCEFQITTAAVEPDPPPKPFIQEARDGCLNIAWSPSPSDGGSKITAYKVRMRKIVGATKWNLAHHVFGPSEENTKWVDMGTVGAAMQEKHGPATYDAWVGPLEQQTCEYRFQIVALSQAGVSKGSELSDPYYT